MELRLTQLPYGQVCACARGGAHAGGDAYTACARGGDVYTACARARAKQGPVRLLVCSEHVSRDNRLEVAFDSLGTASFYGPAAAIDGARRRPALAGS